jgi:hypothetical protein
MEDESKKARSPQFPFISLEKSVARAREFDAAYGQNTGRVGNAVKVWGYAEKSSGGIQTIAALVAFGLIEDEGSNEARKLRLTPLAATILKDKRAGAAEAAIKTAALKPKVLADLWKEWGANRPPNADCISTLHLDKRFTEEAASRLLKIYDDTIKYAKLAASDGKTDNDGVEQEVGNQNEGEGADPPPPPPPLKPQGKVALMSNERVVFAHEIRPNQGLKIVVTGEVDQAMVQALKAYAQFQEMLVAQTPPAEPETK